LVEVEAEYYQELAEQVGMLLLIVSVEAAEVGVPVEAEAADLVVTRQGV
jgi:hypothetical protein